MSTYKGKQPEYDGVKAGDVIEIDGDQWLVSRVQFNPAGFNQYEGTLREYDIDTLGLSLLKVNKVDE